MALCSSILEGNPHHVYYSSQFSHHVFYLRTENRWNGAPRQKLQGLEDVSDSVLTTPHSGSLLNLKNFEKLCWNQLQIKTTRGASLTSLSSEGNNQGQALFCTHCTQWLLMFQEFLENWVFAFLELSFLKIWRFSGENCLKLSFLSNFWWKVS